MQEISCCNRQSVSKEASKLKHSARNATAKEELSSISDDGVIVVNHAFAATHVSENWIVDSGATCHMCNKKKLFRNFEI